MSEIDVRVVERVGSGEVSAPEYVLYGGKGGVGKTTMAAATALASARGGVPTLVVSTDPAHSLSDVLDRDVPTEPERIHPEYPLFGVEIDPNEGGGKGDEREGSGGDLFGTGSPLAGFGLGGTGPNGETGTGGFDMGSDSFGAPMPGADEAAALELLVRYLDDERFSRVVVDTAPTGHTLRLLELPERLDETFDRMVSFRERLEGLFSDAAGSEGGFSGFSGFPGFPGFGDADADVSGFENAGDAGSGSDERNPFGADSGSAGLADLRELRDRITRLRDALSDPARTDFRIVVVPERTSVVESRRLLRRLDAFGVPVGTIVVNRVLENVETVLGLDAESTSETADGESDEREGDHSHDGSERGSDDGVENGDLVAPRPDSCPFCRRRLRSQMDALGDADDLFGGRTVKRVPLFAAEARGESFLRVVGACLD